MKKYKAIIEAIFILGAIIGIYAYLVNSIDTKIGQKLDDPEFIQKVAKELRLPFLIIDEKNIIHYETGALEYIDDIEIVLNEISEIDHIIIIPKNFLPAAPLVECINSNFDFAEPEKVAQFSWKYTEAKTGDVYLTVRADDERKPLIRRFKVTIIK